MTRNIYYDTEFLEGTQKKRFLGAPCGNTKNTIDLISIGMVDDEGNRYYAISKDFNLREAWNRYDLKPNKMFPLGPMDIKVYWIRQNVLFPIYKQLLEKEYSWEQHGDVRNELARGVYFNKYASFSEFKRLIKKYGKSSKQIAEEVKDFVTKVEVTYKEFKDGRPNEVIDIKEPKVNLYAYYGAYDHVALAWLYGKMVDLPKGFPMHTIDLKQELDRVNDYELKRGGILRKLEGHPAFPKNENAHSAIEDAVWNKKLHEFLKQLN